MTNQRPSPQVPTADAATIEQAMADNTPLLLWLAKGQSAPTDMRKALQTAVDTHKGKITAYIVDTSQAESLAETFEVGKHPVLVTWHDGETLVRRSRPWASDVAGIAENLASRVPTPDDPTEDDEQTNQEEKTVSNKPVKVTDATFEDEVINSDIPVLVDFWAEWCGPCHMIAPALEKLAGEYAGKVKIAKVNVDENPGLSQAFRIMSIPTLMFVKDGKIVGQSAGAAPEPALRDVMEQLIALEVPA